MLAITLHSWFLSAAALKSLLIVQHLWQLLCLYPSLSSGWFHLLFLALALLGLFLICFFFDLVSLLNSAPVYPRNQPLPTQVSPSSLLHLHRLSHAFSGLPFPLQLQLWPGRSSPIQPFRRWGPLLLFASINWSRPVLICSVLGGAFLLWGMLPSIRTSCRWRVQLTRFQHCLISPWDLSMLVYVWWLRRSRKVRPSHAKPLTMWVVQSWPQFSFGRHPGCW